MRKALVVLVAAAIVAAGFSACAPAKPKVKTFVMVPKGVHPYYVPCFAGFQAAGLKYGVKTLEVDPQKFDVTLQAKVIEDLIAQKVDGITISANDDAGLVPVIHDAMKAGIKVITFDAPAPSSEALTYIGTDNQTAGATAAKKMAELMNNEGSLIIIQGGLGATNLNLRTQGFKDAMATAAPNIKILDVVDEGGDFAQTVNKTEAILQTYPKLKAIFGVSAEVAPAAAQVLKQQKKAGKIILAGFDDLKDTLEGIRDGTVSFCLVQKTYNMGWLSVEKLLDAIAKKPIDKVIDTGVLIVDKSNVDTYMDDMKKAFAQ
jgi:ribose transport system substrate-binding protein